MVETTESRDAWLIERIEHAAGHEWWSGEPGAVWTGDAYRAAWFSSREAAESAINSLRLGGYCIVTEHVFALRSTSRDSEVVRAAIIDELFGLGEDGDVLVRIEEAAAAVNSRWSIETGRSTSRDSEVAVGFEHRTMVGASRGNEAGGRFVGPGLYPKPSRDSEVREAIEALPLVDATFDNPEATYDLPGRCLNCGQRFTVRRNKGVESPLSVRCPSCETLRTGGWRDNAAILDRSASASEAGSDRRRRRRRGRSQVPATHPVKVLLVACLGVLAWMAWNVRPVRVDELSPAHRRLLDGDGGMA